jgi:HEAT repeat protein
MALFGPPDIEKEKRKRNVNGLIKALGYQKDMSIRLEAARALGELGDARAVDPLIQILDPDMQKFMREAAAKALGEIGDIRAIEPLLAAAFKDSDELVCRAAAIALEKLGWKPTEATAMKYWLILYRGDKIADLARELAEKKEVAAIQSLIDIMDAAPVESHEAINQALLSFGELALDPLTKALQNHSSNSRQRGIAAKLLGELNLARVVDPLLIAINDKECTDRHFR